MSGKTLYDKLWDSHLVREEADGTCLIYIDRHLVHEVTSPQAFEGLRLTGRKAWRSTSIVANPDHNTPTDHWERGIEEPVARLQVETLDANMKEFGSLLYFPFKHENQGIIHVIGPENGTTLPGMTVVCGDSHTSTHGAFAARLRKENPRLSEDKADFLARHCCVETPEGKVELNFDPYHRLTNPILYRVEEAKACWNRVSAQVLFVAGRDSFFFKQFYPLESPEFRERLAAYQNLREVLLDDCGHNIHHDQPEQLAALIEDFIPFEHVPEHAPADATER